MKGKSSMYLRIQLCCSMERRYHRMNLVQALVILVINLSPKSMKCCHFSKKRLILNHPPKMKRAQAKSVTETRKSLSDQVCIRTGQKQGWPILHD